MNVAARKLFFSIQKRKVPNFDKCGYHGNVVKLDKQGFLSSIVGKFTKFVAGSLPFEKLLTNYPRGQSCGIVFMIVFMIVF